MSASAAPAPLRQSPVNGIAQPGRPVRLSRRVLGAYGAPAFSQALIYGPTGLIIQGIYAKEFGLALRSVALVLFVSSIFDAIINPMVGYGSDRYRARFGSRKPWLICGSGLAVFACWYLYAPTPPVTTGYFMFWLLLAYVGWTMTEVPYGAWMAEISEDGDERTRLATWRATGTYLGSLAFFAIPYLPFLPTREFTADSLRWTAILAAVTLPAFAVLAASIVPNGPGSDQRPVEHSQQGPWRGVFRNRPLCWFTAMFFLYHLAPGMANGVLFFYVDGYLHKGKALAGLFILALPAGVLSVPVWGYLCRRFGKLRAWAVSSALGVLGMLAYLLVPAEGGNTTWLAIIMTSTVFLFGVFPVAAPAVLADVVDYGRLRFGANYAGTYFSIYNMIYKAMPGLGAAVAIALLDGFGFDPHLTKQTVHGTLGLMLTFCVLPALMLAVAVPLIWWFPIDARRQRAIARRVEATRRERGVTDPVAGK